MGSFLKILQIREAELKQIQGNTTSLKLASSGVSSLKRAERASLSGTQALNPALSLQIHQLNSSLDKTYSLLAGSTDDVFSSALAPELKARKKVFNSI